MVTARPSLAPETDLTAKVTGSGQSPVNSHHLLSTPADGGQLSGMEPLAIDAATCVRCAACSIIAPALFEVSRKGSRVLRQPITPDDHRAVRAAAAICPAQAIHPNAP